MYKSEFASIYVPTKIWNYMYVLMLKLMCWFTYRTLNIKLLRKFVWNTCIYKRTWKNPFFLLTIHLYTWPSTNYLHIHISTYLCMHPLTCASVLSSISLYIYIHILSFYPSIYLSFSFSIYLATSPTIALSI